MRKLIYRGLYMASGAASLMATALMIGEQPCSFWFCASLTLYAFAHMTERVG